MTKTAQKSCFIMSHITEKRHVRLTKLEESCHTVTLNGWRGFDLSYLS